MKGLSHVGHRLHPRPTGRLHSRPTGRLHAPGRRPTGDLRTRCGVRTAEAEDRRLPTRTARTGRLVGSETRIR